MAGSKWAAGFYILGLRDSGRWKANSSPSGAFIQFALLFPSTSRYPKFFGNNFKRRWCDDESWNELAIAIARHV